MSKFLHDAAADDADDDTHDDDTHDDVRAMTIPRRFLRNVGGLLGYVGPPLKLLGARRLWPPLFLRLCILV